MCVCVNEEVVLVCCGGGAGSLKGGVGGCEGRIQSVWMPSISVAFRGLPKHRALCFLTLKIKQMNVHKDHMPQMCTDQSTQSTHTINRWKQHKAVRRLNYQPFFSCAKTRADLRQIAANAATHSDCTHTPLVRGLFSSFPVLLSSYTWMADRQTPLDCTWNPCAL